MVFSEIYYPHGWHAFIDGVSANISNVDYVLRGMKVPAGEHIIEFKFDPEVVHTGSTIALASSVLVFMLIILGIIFGIRQKANDQA